MKRLLYIPWIAVALVVSCSTQEKDFQIPAQDDNIFYATFEQPVDDGTKVYATEDFLLRWTADDRVSIFNKLTYNQQYKFTGETGDNAGGFRKVDTDEFVTGDAISHVVSVYPYQETTKITESEILTVTLPAEQTYAQNTFGLGANSMVSVTADNFLQYKNIGGYLVIQLYGEGVSISSISLKGNNGEKLSGMASVTMPLDGVPSVELASDAMSEITLTCPEPVALGATAEESIQFWFVVPPVTFSKGFTITVNQYMGSAVEKTTSKSVTIDRNNLYKMSPLEVVPVFSIKKYLTFTSEGTTYVSLNDYGNNAPVLFYSTDKTNWTRWDYSELAFTIDQPLYLCGDNPKGFSSESSQCVFTTREDNFAVSGDIMALIDSEHDLAAIPSQFCFSYLFYRCTGLTSAPELPATTMTAHCYNSMFCGCINLTTAPDLPATILAEGCYERMFSGCSSLLMAPELPATTLADVCYERMFWACSSLTKAPELPATGLASGCYQSMFAGCTSLTEIPELSAVTLASECYSEMYSGCTSLTTAPEKLPATTLTDSCYSGMFLGCSSLTNAPVLPATTLAEGCYESMFSGCSSLLMTPELPATELASGCYQRMFSGCTSLTETLELPAVTLAAACYYGMYSGCSSLINPPVLPATVLAESCYREMFSFCTSLTIAPELPATVLASCCYQSMFEGCISLSKANELPAVTLAAVCYYGMFAGCTSLITAPEKLPATTLTESCYSGMFGSCSSLTNAPELPATVLAPGCYCDMFWGCSSLAEAPKLPATNLEYACYESMFYGCTSLIRAPDLMATVLAYACYQRMFYNCNQLNFIKCFAMDISAWNCTTDWLKGVAAIGTFVKASGMNDWTDGTSGIPEGWTVIDNTPNLIPEPVDMGFSLKRASFNLGAYQPKDNGDYHAWVETGLYYSNMDPFSWKDGKEFGYADESYR